MSRELARSARFLALYALAWTPVASCYALLIFFQSGDGSIGGAIIGSVMSTVLAALLGLWVWRSSQRLATGATRGGAFAVQHLWRALVYGTVWTALNILSIARFAPPHVLDEFLGSAAGWHLFTGFLFYGIIGGIAHGVAVNTRLRREQDAAARSDALRVRAELAAIRSQINPHFLFNTLHSISALVRSEPAVAEQALERLGLLLRRVLEHGSRGDDVTLAEEWAIVRDQLELEQLRFGDRLRVETDIEEDALDCAIPTMALQVLVENAVRHGIGPAPRGGTVTISARIEGEHLVIEVSDDGVGCDPATVLNGQGFGVRSVSQRLHALYGSDASLAVVAASGEGVRARMTVPMRVVRAPVLIEPMECVR